MSDAPSEQFGGMGVEPSGTQAETARMCLVRFEQVSVNPSSNLSGIPPANPCRLVQKAAKSMRVVRLSPLPGPGPPAPEYHVESSWSCTF